MEKSKPNVFWAVSNFLGRSTHTVNAHSKIATERTAIETQQSTKTKQVGAVEVTTQRYCAGVKIQGCLEREKAYEAYSIHIIECNTIQYRSLFGGNVRTASSSFARGRFSL